VKMVAVIFGAILLGTATPYAQNANMGLHKGYGMGRVPLPPRVAGASTNRPAIIAGSHAATPHARMKWSVFQTNDRGR
jgi:hypothetical protein